MSASGSAVRCCSATQTARTTRPAANRPSVAGRPSPIVGRAIARSGSGQADREHDGAADVDAPGRAVRATRGSSSSRDRCDGGADGAEPEDPVVAGVVDDDAAEDQAGPPPMPNVAEIRPMLERDALARELVADDAEAEREDAAARALHDAAGDDDLEACAERRDDGAGGEDHERDHEQAPLAEHVAEAAEDRREDRRRDQVAGERPRDAAASVSSASRGRRWPG